MAPRIRIRIGVKKLNTDPQRGKKTGSGSALKPMRIDNSTKKYTVHLQSEPDQSIRKTRMQLISLDASYPLRSDILNLFPSFNNIFVYRSCRYWDSFLLL